MDLSDTVDELLGEIESTGAAIERAASDSPMPSAEVIAQQAAAAAPASSAAPAPASPNPPQPPEPFATSMPAVAALVADAPAPEQTIEQVDKLLQDAAARLDQGSAPSPESIKSLDEHISKLTDQMLGAPDAAKPATAAPSTAPQPAPSGPTQTAPAPDAAAAPAKAPSPTSAPSTRSAPPGPTPEGEHAPQASGPPAGEPPVPAAASVTPQIPSEPLRAKLRRWLAPINTLALQGCAAACKPLDSHGIHAHKALSVIAIATAACATMTWGIVLFRPAPQDQVGVEAFDFEHGTPPPIVHHAEESSVPDAAHEAPGGGTHDAKAAPKKDAKKPPAKSSKKDPKKDPKKAQKKPPSGGGGGH